MKRLKQTLFLSVPCLLAVSCVEERYGGADDISAGDDRATITFNVRAPGLMRGGSTRAFPEGFEDNIDDITIFLAHDRGSGFTMDSMVVVDRFRAVSATTQTFTLELPTSTVPTKIFVAANLMDADNGLAADYAASFTAAGGRGMAEGDFIRTLTDKWAEVGTDAAGTGAACMYMAGTV